MTCHDCHECKILNEEPYNSWKHFVFEIPEMLMWVLKMFVLYCFITGGIFAVTLAIGEILLEAKYQAYFEQFHGVWLSQQ